jgi:hypothetical protein
MKSGPLAAACAALVAGAALLVPGCGGGVGSGGTGMAIGTINGFGSVIVDGARYDDSAVPTLREDAPGVETQAQARLGQRAEVRFTDGGIASALMVDATLIGTVSRVDASGAFSVLGQSVSANSDPSLGPVTQFAGGYTGAASVLAGDAVEVHGLIVVQGTAFVVQATRIERLAALPTYLKATGIVAGTGARCVRDRVAPRRCEHGGGAAGGRNDRRRRGRLGAGTGDVADGGCRRDAARRRRASAHRQPRRGCGAGHRERCRERARSGCAGASRSAASGSRTREPP